MCGFLTKKGLNLLIQNLFYPSNVLAFIISLSNLKISSLWFRNWRIWLQNLDSILISVASSVSQNQMLKWSLGAQFFLGIHTCKRKEVKVGLGRGRTRIAMQTGQSLGHPWNEGWPSAYLTFIPRHIQSLVQADPGRMSPHEGGSPQLSGSRETNSCTVYEHSLLLVVHPFLKGDLGVWAYVYHHLPVDTL